MRKFLRIFFWSHGTLLGYLGSLSQKAVPEIFSKWVLINLSNPLRHPKPLVDPLLTKILDTAVMVWQLTGRKVNVSREGICQKLPWWRHLDPFSQLGSKISTDTKELWAANDYSHFLPSEWIPTNKKQSNYSHIYHSLLFRLLFIQATHTDESELDNYSKQISVALQ